MRIGYDRLKSDDYGEGFGLIILAAGLSSRMKAFKPLLYVAGMTAVEGLIESAKTAGIEDITIVSGNRRELLVPVIESCAVHEAYNPDYEQGMFSSIKTGLRLANDASQKRKVPKDGYLLVPVDCPLISTRVMRAVMDAASEGTASESFVVATFEGKKAHPLYIPADKIEEICAYDGPGGLSSITDKYAESILRVPVDEEGCLLDMDTPEGYEDIKDFAAKGFAREKLELLSARKRIFLVRHGETMRHDEPMFIGQYDVELSEDGLIQAELCGGEIAEIMKEDIEAEALGMDRFGKEAMPAIERIYSSDLKRARRTAEIIRDKINVNLPRPVGIKLDPGLREINLGDWDGRPVREIREKYAQEYERRGRDVMSFKLRNGMENFYDMQYRVMAAFREILRNDDAKDIIVVTHSGVIRALENNLRGLRVEDSWEALAKGKFRMLEPFPKKTSDRTSEYI